MAARGIVRLSYEEDDVYASEATKVNPLSPEAISEMLETAERQHTSSSPPARESGVREIEPSSTRPPPSGTNMILAIPAAPALPVIYDDDDDGGLEPTRLSDRVAIPSEALVAQLHSEPPIIIEPRSVDTPITEIPVSTPAVTARVVDLPPVLDLPVEPGFVAPSVSPTKRRRSKFDRADWAVAAAAFVVTLVPSLVALHYLLQR